jgi:hypothetical protein
MTLASSGEMSLAGTATDRSIQVELGGDGSTQISLNDSNVRALAEKETPGSAVNMSTDFYGKSAAGGITARYIRLTGFERTKSRGPMISGFALYADENLTNLIIGENANDYPNIPELSASFNGGSWTPNRAGSSSITSGWFLDPRTNAEIINDWIQYDMGSPITIGSILVRNGYSTNITNYWASAFDVEWSNDGTNWTLIQSVTVSDPYPMPDEHTINT